MDLRYAVDCRSAGMFALLGPFTQPMRRDKKVTTFLTGRGVLMGTSKSPVVVDVTSQVQKKPEDLARIGYFMVLESNLDPGQFSLTHEIGEAEKPFFRDTTPVNSLQVFRNASYTHFVVSFKEDFGEYSTERQTIVTPSVGEWLADDANYAHPEGSPESLFLKDLVSKTTL